MKILITGGCGFLGANLAGAILTQGAGELSIIDDLSRKGSFENLTWLTLQGNFSFYQNDVRATGEIEKLVGVICPDIIFHFAGQVAMTTSIADPRRDFEINALGTINVLEAVRKYAPMAKVVYASTNKVYGDLEWIKYQESETRYIALGYPNGFTEELPLSFHSPYGCSKGCADQYLLDYYRIFGIRTVVFRHSSMFGGRQFSTYDQGWIGWFCKKAIEVKNKNKTGGLTISGNGKQVRDILYADDMIGLYMRMIHIRNDIYGQSFNIGGGPANSLSLLELFDFLEKELNIRLPYSQLPPRSSDQKVFIADISKACKLLGWKPAIDKTTGIKRMIEWVKVNE